MVWDLVRFSRVRKIEMHPGNRVLFVFRDGHAEENFWKDRSRRDSWDAEKRKRAAEKTRAQRQRGKENPEQCVKGAEQRGDPVPLPKGSLSA